MPGLAFRPAAQLSYQHAQDVIEGKGLGNVPIGDGHPASGIEDDIAILHVWSHLFGVFGLDPDRCSVETRQAIA